MDNDMNDPKTFYRELDALLAKIGEDKSGKNNLDSIFIELEQKFGDRLYIHDGCIYEQRDKDFILIFNAGHNRWEQKMSLESEAVQWVLKHGSFIFDETAIRGNFILKNESGNIVPAAISINSPERQWLFVFGLKDGWIREEIILFLNAVRTAINYRLFSEIIDDELKRTVQIQKSLLPKTTPKIKGYQIFGRSIPAELVGGDFYEYFDLEEGNSGVSIGDASGHGLPAALLVRDVVIGLRMGLASEHRIVHIIKKLNKVIQQSTYESNFVSLFVGEIEKEGHLSYVNAGHPAPFLVSGDKVYDLGPTGIVLGFLNEIELHRSYINLEPESVLVLYTDGVVERADSEDNHFGLERLKNLVLENQKKCAKEINDLIIKTVFDFGNRTNWDDDVTVVMLKKM
jgi:sigma-B regulation protein RsbU (phosphoserine phosphatase)